MPQSILSSIMENRGAGARSVSTDGPGSFAPSHREGHFKQKSAQRKVDEFWSKFNTQVPGKGQYWRVPKSFTVSSCLVV